MFASRVRRFAVLCVLALAARPALAQGGSIGGKVSVPHLVPYSASKFAVVGLSEALGAELAPHGIRVTAICPGVIATDIVRAGRLEGAVGERKQVLESFYQKRGIPPERVARDILRAVKSGTPLATTLGASYPALLLRRVSPRLWRSTAGLALGRIIGTRGSGGPDDARAHTPRGEGA